MRKEGAKQELCTMALGPQGKALMPIAHDSPWTRRSAEIPEQTFPPADTCLPWTIQAGSATKCTPFLRAHTYMRCGLSLP